MASAGLADALEATRLLLDPARFVFVWVVGIKGLLWNTHGGPLMRSGVNINARRRVTLAAQGQGSWS